MNAPAPAPATIPIENIGDYSFANQLGNSALKQIWSRCYEKFREVGWPRQADEEWRRTDISGYRIGEYAVSTYNSCLVEIPSSSADAVFSYSLAELFREATPSNGVNNNINTVRASLLELLQCRTECATHKIELLPLLILNLVHIVYVPRNAVINDPIELIVNHSDNVSGKVLTPFLLVAVVEEGAEATLTIRYNSSSDNECAIVSDVLCLLHNNARCQITSISDINIDSIHISSGMAWIGQDSVLKVGTAIVNGMLSKHRFDAYLDGQGSEAYLDGCYIGCQDQHIDVRTQQIHRAPSTNSFALYRGIGNDESHIIYQGLIEVQENAMKTDAYLTNNNILLSDEARSDSIPSLNIKTDDVKCSHGSTTGAIDELQLFYLQARGIGKDEAIRLIVEGFLGEVIDRYPQSVREPLLQRFTERLS